MRPPHKMFELPQCDHPHPFFCLPHTHTHISVPVSHIHTRVSLLVSTLPPLPPPIYAAERSPAAHQPLCGAVSARRGPCTRVGPEGPGAQVRGGGEGGEGGGESVKSGCGPANSPHPPDTALALRGLCRNLPPLRDPSSPALHPFLAFPLSPSPPNMCSYFSHTGMPMRPPSVLAASCASRRCSCRPGM